MRRIRLINLVAALVVLAGLLGMGPAVAAGEKVLHVYTWSDYFDSEVLYLFEKEHGCRVLIDYFDSNESMYAKLKAGGGGYDVITPSSYMSGIMEEQGMLSSLRHDLIPNLDHIDKKFTSYTEDPEMRFSIPYTRTVTGIGYNKRRVSEDALGSWDIFANNAYSKRMTMLNDMRETIGAGLKYLGYSLNTIEQSEIDEATNVIIGWKRNLAKFDVDEAKIGLGAGEFLAVQAYNGDVALIMDETPDIGFYIPREGSSLASDDFVVAADTPQSELAHAFINHMLNPEIAALNMESIRYYMPNSDAVEMLDVDLKDNPAFNVQEEMLSKCEVIRDLGEHNAKYVAAWDKIKAAD